MRTMRMAVKGTNVSRIRLLDTTYALELSRAKTAGPLSQVHGAKRVFPIPEGLKELSSDIIREVLRHQPECIHAFIAEYLETMLMVREKARDSTSVVSDVFAQGYFFEELYRTKKVDREMANEYATCIQAAWRGYVVRKKVRQYLQKKRKIQEEREQKEALVINEFLESVGLTYDEATRAACIIQQAYKKSRRGKWVTTDDGEEVFQEAEDVPLGQRVREQDRSAGRYDRWDKKDWGVFFDMDPDGEIKYEWPRLGQFMKIPRKMVKPDMSIVRFFAMRDFDGHEQYSYLAEQQKDQDMRGFPIGFIIPVNKSNVTAIVAELEFVDPEKNEKMGNYTYVYECLIGKDDLNNMKTNIEYQKSMESKTHYDEEYMGESEFDPTWIVPRVLIQIQKNFLKDTDDEVRFLNEAYLKEIDTKTYTFIAENKERSLAVISYILKSRCATMEEALEEAGNLREYKRRTTGRFFEVEEFETPKYIQKVFIYPETKKGATENADMDEYEYVLVPRHYKWKTKKPKPENPIRIPMTRFAGHRTYYTGSKNLKNKVFIMGPMLHTPDGKPLTFKSYFWEEFGPESWYQLLCRLTTEKIRRAVHGEQSEIPDEESSESTEESIEEKEDLGEALPTVSEKPAAAAIEEVPEVAEVVEVTEDVPPIDKETGRTSTESQVREDDMQTPAHSTIDGREQEPEPEPEPEPEHHRPHDEESATKETEEETEDTAEEEEEE